MYINTSVIETKVKINIASLIPVISSALNFIIIKKSEKLLFKYYLLNLD